MKQAGRCRSRSYHRAHGHLAPRQDALRGEEDNGLVPVGQLIANLRRKDGLGKNPQRAVTRAAQLAAIDPNWACPWPLNWQRHHRILTHIADTEPDGTLPHIQPGVTYENDDLGKWIHQQTHTWVELTGERRRHRRGSDLPNRQTDSLL